MFVAGSVGEGAVVEGAGVGSGTVVEARSGGNEEVVLATKLFDRERLLLLLLL